MRIVNKRINIRIIDTSVKECMVANERECLLSRAMSSCYSLSMINKCTNSSSASQGLQSNCQKTCFGDDPMTCRKPQTVDP